MKKKCKHKSLLTRIRFLTMLTTTVSVLIMTIIMFVLFGKGLKLVESNISEHFADQTENIILRLATENDGKIVIDNRKASEEIAKLHKGEPFLTIDVKVNNQSIYSEFGDLRFTETFAIKFDGEAKEISENLSDKMKIVMPQNHIERELFNSVGEMYGSIRVGIDDKLIETLHLLIVVIVIPIALIVMLVMGVFAKLLTKPILRPISQLTKQVNQLADEEYDTMAPTLALDKNCVKEVYNLGLATNRLLAKMLDYNEVITQSEKMASVGQLTAAITHEINTPLGAINANVSMIKLLSEAITGDVLENSENINEIKEQMIDAATLSEEACIRIDKIVRSLKLYTRIDQADFMPADINESVKSVVVLTTNLHKNRIKINEHYGVIPEVICHIGLINQVFMNLFINAIQAIDNKGVITITTLSDEENVYVSITDTGCGISAKNIYNIFQYGFTTKQPGSGSGIGLALSNNIIKKHNGNIAVDSKEGQGSTFTVTIPIKQNCTKE